MLNHKFSFQSFIKEQTSETDSFTGTASTFIFMDGTLPKDHETVVDFDAYKAPKNVRLTPTVDGSMVEIFHDESIEPVYATVPNTRTWLVTEGEQVSMFFELIQ